MSLRATVACQVGSLLVFVFLSLCEAEDAFGLLHDCTSSTSCASDTLYCVDSSGGSSQQCNVSCANEACQHTRIVVANTGGLNLQCKELYSCQQANVVWANSENMDELVAMNENAAIGGPLHHIACIGKYSCLMLSVNGSTQQFGLDTKTKWKCLGDNSCSDAWAAYKGTVSVDCSGQFACSGFHLTCLSGGNCETTALSHDSVGSNGASMTCLPEAVSCECSEYFDCDMLTTTTMTTTDYSMCLTAIHSGAEGDCCALHQRLWKAQSLEWSTQSWIEYWANDTLLETATFEDCKLLDSCNCISSLLSADAMDDEWCMAPVRTACIDLCKSATDTWFETVAEEMSHLTNDSEAENVVCDAFDSWHNDALSFCLSDYWLSQELTLSTFEDIIDLCYFGTMKPTKPTKPTKTTTRVQSTATPKTSAESRKTTTAVPMTTPKSTEEEFQTYWSTTTTDDSSNNNHTTTFGILQPTAASPLLVVLVVAFLMTMVCGFVYYVRTEQESVHSERQHMRLADASFHTNSGFGEDVEMDLDDTDSGSVSVDGRQIGGRMARKSKEHGRDGIGEAAQYYEEEEEGLGRVGGRRQSAALGPMSGSSGAEDYGFDSEELDNAEIGNLQQSHTVQMSERVGDEMVVMESSGSKTKIAGASSVKRKMKSGMRSLAKKARGRLGKDQTASDTPEERAALTAAVREFSAEYGFNSDTDEEATERKEAASDSSKAAAVRRHNLIQAQDSDDLLLSSDSDYEAKPISVVWDSKKIGKHHFPKWLQS